LQLDFVARSSQFIDFEVLEIIFQKRFERIWKVIKKGISLQPLSKGSRSPETEIESLKRLKRGSEKRIKKLEKSFGSLEKTITFAAAKTRRVH